MFMKSPFDTPREVPYLGRVVDVGETVEVPTNVVDAFFAAGWTEGEAPAVIEASVEINDDDDDDDDEEEDLS